MLHLEVWTLAGAIPTAAFGDGCWRQTCHGTGQWHCSRTPTSLQECTLLSKREIGWETTNSVPSLHVVWLKSAHLLVFCRGSGNSSNPSSFVAGQILFKLLELLRLCWKVTLQSAVLDPIEDQRYALNYTIESFSAKDDRTGILYPQQQEYRTLHTLREMIRGKKGKWKKKEKG